MHQNKCRTYLVLAVPCYGS